MANKPKRWIAKAVPKGHEGRLRAKAESAGESTKEFAQEHKGGTGKTGRQSRLALTLMGMRGNSKSRLYAGKKE